MSEPQHYQAATTEDKFDESRLCIGDEDCTWSGFRSQCSGPDLYCPECGGPTSFKPIRIQASPEGNKADDRSLEPRAASRRRPRVVTRPENLECVCFNARCHWVGPEKDLQWDIEDQPRCPRCNEKDLGFYKKAWPYRPSRPVSINRSTIKKEVNLDELQASVEKLLGLLKDRQPGLFMWNAALRDRINEIHQQTAL